MKGVLSWELISSHREALHLFKIVEGYEKVNLIDGGEEGTRKKTTPGAREVTAEAKNLVKVAVKNITLTRGTGSVTRTNSYPYNLSDSATLSKVIASAVTLRALGVVFVCVPPPIYQVNLLITFNTF